MITTLDFSKPRLRVNGKAVDKFTVASLIDSIKSFVSAVICMDAYTYVELIDLLKRVLVERNFVGIYGETYNTIAL